MIETIVNMTSKYVINTMCFTYREVLKRNRFSLSLPVGRHECIAWKKDWVDYWESFANWCLDMEEEGTQITVKVVIFARVIFRALAIFDIFACF